MLVICLGTQTEKLPGTLEKWTEGSSVRVKDPVQEMEELRLNPSGIKSTLSPDWLIDGSVFPQRGKASGGIKAAHR